MTTGDETQPGDTPTEQTPPPRRPSPTSRARRIGGLSRPATGASAPATERGIGIAASPDPAVGTTAPPEPAGREAGTGSGSATAAADETYLEADTETDTDTEAAEAAHAPVATPAWLRWLPATALGAAALVMLVFFAVAAHGVWWGRPSANAVRDEVLSAAKGCFAQANTYHYTSLAADEAKGAACATAAYAKNYRQVMQTVIKPKAAQQHVVQVAQVFTAGISQISPNGGVWTILVVGQLQISATSLPHGRTDPVAALVEMTKVDGRWRISSLREVSGPTGG